MRKSLALLAIAFAVGATAFDAEAKRLGGGKSSGMQRQGVTNSAPAPTRDAGGSPATPSQAAAPSAAAAATAAPAAAATAKRSWLGPVAGIAAGLGIAALASHFGFGEALANMLTFALIAMAVLLVVGFILRKRAQQRGAGLEPALAGPARTPVEPVQPQGMQRTGSLIGSGVARNIPADFDTAAFERNAKSQFMALQQANDTGDLDRLRDFLTPEMLTAAQDEIRARNGEAQATEVFGLEARVLEVVTEADRYIASVRFTGSLRQQPGVAPEPLDEVWHLVKPVAGMQGWLVAGIQQAD